jgi:hypothetical protein
MDHPTCLYHGKNADDYDLTDHPTNPHRGKNTDNNGLTDPSNTASIFYLLIVLQKLLINTLEIKTRRLVDMTMTRSILQKLLIKILVNLEPNLIHVLKNLNESF